MELFNYFRDTLNNSFNINILGLTLFELFFIIIIFFISMLLRELFAKLVISKIKKIVIKTGNEIDDKLFDALKAPLKLLPIVLVFILISFFINLDSNLGLYFEKVNRSLITIFVFWFIHQSLIPLSKSFEKLQEHFSKALVIWLFKSLKYLIIFLAIVAVLETWGIKIGPIIAGLGLLGVAVALGAQDLFKNLISGILIILEKRFNIGDVINVPFQAMGNVEHIGFRSTLIRKFDSTPITIPNYVFSDSSIINFSERPYRRIYWTIGVVYGTSIDELKKICLDIEAYINNSKDFLINSEYQLYVRIEKFNDSSIDILIHAFTNTNKWDEYLKIKENLAYKIKSIIENNNSDFAFPSRTIYTEKK